MEHSTTQKPSRLYFFMTIGLSILTVILLGTLIFTIVTFQSFKKTATVPVEAVSNTSSVPEAVVPEEETISVAALKEYSEKYNVSAEFLQNFFDDVIVYKSTGGIKYAEIDESLPKNNFNFDNIVAVEGEKQYMENGISTGTKVIDVSKHQGVIDWAKVKASGVDYAMLRLGNRGYETGKLVLDETFDKNIKGAAAAGIKVGAYFFSQAISEAEAIEEAELVLEHTKGYELALPVAYDTEEVHDSTTTIRTAELTAAQRTDYAIAFCEKIKAAGHTPMIYSNIKWYVEGLEMSRLVQYEKWFAQYYAQPFFPYELSMWQYTGSGKVAGIKGDVDMNIMFEK